MKKILLSVLLILCFATSVFAAWGAFEGAQLGTSYHNLSTSSPITSDLKADHAGVAFRFTAKSTDDVKSVALRFGTVTAVTGVTVEIWTIDTATGKPSSIYDAKATATATPTANATNVFSYAADPPTTGLVVGDEYAIVIINHTTGGATACILQSHVTPYAGALIGSLPVTVLSTTDAGSAWTEVASTLPVCSVVFEGDAVHNVGFCPVYTITANKVYDTHYAGGKFVLDTTVSAIGIYAAVGKTGTPTANLTMRLYKDNNTVVTGAVREVNLHSLETQITTGIRVIRVLFPAAVSLTAGTYRISIDGAAANDANHCWQVYHGELLDASSLGSDFRIVTSTDSGAAWTDTTAKPFMGGILIDDIPSVAGASMSVQ